MLWKDEVCISIPQSNFDSTDPAFCESSFLSFFLDYLRRKAGRAPVHTMFARVLDLKGAFLKSRFIKSRDGAIYLSLLIRRKRASLGCVRRDTLCLLEGSFSNIRKGFYRVRHPPEAANASCGRQCSTALTSACHVLRRPPAKEKAGR